MDMMQLAETVYVAWCRANKGVGPDGAALPSWAELPLSERSEWKLRVEIKMELRRGLQMLHELRAKVAKMGPRAAAILTPVLDEMPAVALKGRLAVLWWVLRSVWAACRASLVSERAASTPWSAS